MRGELDRSFRLLKSSRRISTLGGHEALRGRPAPTCAEGLHGANGAREKRLRADAGGEGRSGYSYPGLRGNMNDGHL